MSGLSGSAAAAHSKKTPRCEPSMNVDYVSIGRNPPEEVNAVIEVPIGGEPIKYEMDKEAGTLRPNGVLKTTDEGGGDEKIIGIPIPKLAQRYAHVANLPEITWRQIEHFFSHYEDLEANKWVACPDGR